MNADINMSECLKETSNLTEKIITNVCNGKVTTVPFGTLDLFGNFAAVGVISFSAVIFFCLILLLIKEL